MPRLVGRTSPTGRSVARLTFSESGCPVTRLGNVVSREMGICPPSAIQLGASVPAAGAARLPDTRTDVGELAFTLMAVASERNLAYFV